MLHLKFAVIQRVISTRWT